MRENLVSIETVKKLIELRQKRVIDEGARTNQPEAAQKSKKSRSIKFNAAEYAAGAKKYHPDHLNPAQKLIFEYAFNNPGHTILVQAGPGTGKTFTMLTIAYSSTKPVTTIIYKRDLLYPFRHCAELYSTTQFCMKLFTLGYKQYQALDKQIASNMSVEEMVISIVGLLRRALQNSMKTFGDCSIAIIDEHTLVPKLLLFVILLLGKILSITFIFCGDRNQLQNIHNSIHAGEISSYDIIESFADKVFTLNKNQRCKDNRYNAILEYVSNFSCKTKLDPFGYALVSAIFYDRLTTSTRISDIHIACTHKLLTSTVGTLVNNTRTDVQFYYLYASPSTPRSRVRGSLDPETGLYLPYASRPYEQGLGFGKFLPYLPLVKGAAYFVEKYSENCIFILVSYDISRRGAEVAILERNGVRKEVRRGNCKDVMFEEHAKYLIDGGDEAGSYFDKTDPAGVPYNFPIYPAFVMSVYMAQGRTIDKPIDFMVDGCTWDQLYVAISRVTEREKFARVLIPDTLPYLVSSIINFEKLSREPELTLDIQDIKKTFGSNYKLYDLRDLNSMTVFHLQLACTRFIVAKSVIERCKLRSHIIYLCRGARFSIIHSPAKAKLSARGFEASSRPIEKNLSKYFQIDENQSESLFKFTLAYFLQHKSIFYPLTLMNKQDAFIWVREYLSSANALRSVLSEALDQKRVQLLYDKDESIEGDNRSWRTLRSINSISSGFKYGESTFEYIKRTAEKNDLTSKNRQTEEGEAAYQKGLDEEFLTFTDPREFIITPMLESSAEGEHQASNRINELEDQFESYSLHKGTAKQVMGSDPSSVNKLLSEDLDKTASDEEKLVYSKDPKSPNIQEKITPKYQLLKLTEIASHVATRSENHRIDEKWLQNELKLFMDASLAFEKIKASEVAEASVTTGTESFENDRDGDILNFSACSKKRRFEGLLDASSSAEGIGDSGSNKKRRFKGLLADDSSSVGGIGDSKVRRKRTGTQSFGNDRHDDNVWKRSRPEGGVKKGSSTEGNNK